VARGNHVVHLVYFRVDETPYRIVKHAERYNNGAIQGNRIPWVQTALDGRPLQGNVLNAGVAPMLGA